MTSCLSVFLTCWCRPGGGPEEPARRADLAGEGAPLPVHAGRRYEQGPEPRPHQPTEHRPLGPTPHRPAGPGGLHSGGVQLSALIVQFFFVFFLELSHFCFGLLSNIRHKDFRGCAHVCSVMLRVHPTPGFWTRWTEELLSNENHLKWQN